MQNFTTKKKLAKYLNSISQSKEIGFIPTMGALHEGHLKLIEESYKVCDITICSIFVNPTQFNNQKDLDNYPRKIEEDLKLLKATKCDIAYLPETNDLYPFGNKIKEYNFGGFESLMEGKYRPNHFNGVATVLEKLFSIINPQKVFFGQKDLQQLQIVKALIKQTKMPVKIIGVETVREKNGLAKSSRNQLLSYSEKKDASLIFKSLLYCKQNKSKEIRELKKEIEKRFDINKNIRLEYIEFVDINNMRRITCLEKNTKYAICIAAYISGVRLIDNIIL